MAQNEDRNGLGVLKDRPILGTATGNRIHSNMTISLISDKEAGSWNELCVPTTNQLNIRGVFLGKVFRYDNGVETDFGEEYYVRLGRVSLTLYKRRTNKWLIWLRDTLGWFKEKPILSIKMKSKNEFFVKHYSKRRIKNIESVTFTVFGEGQKQLIRTTKSNSPRTKRLMEKLNLHVVKGGKS